MIAYESTPGVVSRVRGIKAKATEMDLTERFAREQIARRAAEATLVKAKLDHIQDERELREIIAELTVMNDYYVRDRELAGTWLQEKVNKQRKELKRMNEERDTFKSTIQHKTAAIMTLEHRVSQLETRLAQLEGDGVVY